MLYLQRYKKLLIAPMEPNIIQIVKQLAEYIEFTQNITEMNFVIMNVGEEIKI